MRITNVTCDACGKSITEDESDANERFIVSDPIEGTDLILQLKHTDLCEDCHKLLKTSVTTYASILIDNCKYASMLIDDCKEDVKLKQGLAEDSLYEPIG